MQLAAGHRPIIGNFISVLLDFCNKVFGCPAYFVITKRNDFVILIIEIDVLKRV